MAFGSNYSGELGLGAADKGTKNAVLAPVLVPFFASRPVQHLACGEQHVIAVTRSNQVFSWGCGELGRLGMLV